MASCFQVSQIIHIFIRAVYRHARDRSYLPSLQWATAIKSHFFTRITTFHGKISQTLNMQVRALLISPNYSGVPLQRPAVQLVRQP